ncbi:MAG: transposase [Chloroflexi bacterium]|nr:transposase [Chloroflexota bacterium]
MILTAKVKLETSKEQFNALKHTLETTNRACDFLSEIAWQNKVFGRFGLQKIAYQPCRERFPALSSQLVVRAMAKVADAYKLDKKARHTFKPHGAISYDSRILNWNLTHKQVSIWTIIGRLKIGFAAGPRQMELLAGERGETDLCLIDGVFYLFVSCKIADVKPIDVQDVLGVDLGIVNLATDSDGERHGGAAIDKKRRIYAHRRRNLQRKGTRSAKRRLKQLAGRQARFQANTNHCISKHVVKKAQDTERSIALENLTGIRERVTVRKPQRARHANWAFHQLRTYIAYKADMAGIPVILVDPRNTSRACPKCGNIAKANRPNQSTFRCTACGHVANADVNAAENIRSRARAVVNQPMVANGVAKHDSATSLAL